MPIHFKYIREHSHMTSDVSGHFWPTYLGSLHKLRLHFLAFDHVRTPPSLHFLCSKSSIFLTTYPPLNANVICEGSLTGSLHFIHLLTTSIYWVLKVHWFHCKINVYICSVCKYRCYLHFSWSHGCFISYDCSVIVPSKTESQQYHWSKNVQ